MMVKKPKKRTQIRKCDTLFSQIIRDRGSCERCGSKGNTLQTAHFISRANKNVRWDFDNAMCFCFRCHFIWAHQNPDEFTEFMKERLGTKRFRGLRERANSTDKPDYDKVYRELERRTN